MNIDEESIEIIVSFLGSCLKSSAICRTSMQKICNFKYLKDFNAEAVSRVKT